MGSNVSTLPEKQSEVVATETPSTSTESKPKKKICCACPDTKKLRDECIVEHGEAACTKYIEAHLECLRAEGFKI
ncbi:Cytochrome c oxidase copper chaperone 2 [Zostera marina]|uniref:Cytochrome c oxidase copper chaperone 2 n=1 Tax=Zostera marina TaxID=29655 RepID=A0A0K9PE16_ZOSMR|nr:Cytochrome c oxidase copper chaperone 2 [Zostera marina]